MSALEELAELIDQERAAESVRSQAQSNYPGATDSYAMNAAVTREMAIRGDLYYDATRALSKARWAVDEFLRAMAVTDLVPGDPGPLVPLEPAAPAAKREEGAH